MLIGVACIPSSQVRNFCLGDKPIYQLKRVIMSAHLNIILLTITLRALKKQPELGLGLKGDDPLPVAISAIFCYNFK